MKSKVFHRVINSFKISEFVYVALVRFVFLQSLCKAKPYK